MKQSPAKHTYTRMLTGYSALLYICLFLPLQSSGQTSAEATQSKSSPPAETTSFNIKDGDGHRDLYFGDRAIWRHMNSFDKEDRETTYKTYHHVFQFGSDSDFITKGAGGKFTHHRGIYLGWSKTKSKKGTHDFWHVKGTNEQSVRHIKYLEETISKTNAVISSETHWITPEGDAVVKDIRQLTTSLLPSGALQLDFAIQLQSVDGDVQLHGDPQHAGFQFRPENSVTTTHATYLRDKNASGGKGDVWATCNWVANTFKSNSKTYTVLHMNHPENAGETVYSTRNYGRFGAYAPHELKADDTLSLNYRLLIMEGTTTEEACETAFKSFAP